MEKQRYLYSFMVKMLLPMLIFFIEKKCFQNELTTIIKNFPKLKNYSGTLRTKESVDFVLELCMLLLHLII